jgi:DDB1- and CUL4-associated factor 11
MSSDSDSDYEPAEEDERSEGENLAQAYLARLLAGGIEVDDGAGEEDDGGG